MDQKEANNQNKLHAAHLSEPNNKVNKHAANKKYDFRLFFLGRCRQYLRPEWQRLFLRCRRRRCRGDWFQDSHFIQGHSHAIEWFEYAHERSQEEVTTQYRRWNQLRYNGYVSTTKEEEALLAAQLWWCCWHLAAFQQRYNYGHIDAR